MALVLAIHVEVLRDDIVSHQSDMYFSENKIENGTKETENICLMKMDESSRHYVNKRKEQFEMKRHKNGKTSEHSLKKNFTDIETGIRNYSDLS